VETSTSSVRSTKLASTDRLATCATVSSITRGTRSPAPAIVCGVHSFVLDRPFIKYSDYFHEPLLLQ